MSAVSISLPRPLSILQKNGSNQGSWAISGTYTFASACHLEADFNGAGFSRIATLSAGTAQPYSGNLLNQAAGIRGTLTVRFEEDTATSATVTCGIGIVFAAATDSTGTGAQYSSYPGYTTTYGISIKNATASDDDWFDGNDSGRTDAIRKSQWVQYADLVAQQNACCVGFIYETHGGTDLAIGGGWDATAAPSWVTGGGFLANFQAAITALHGSNVSHIVAEFGPNAIAGHPTLAAYKARMQEVGPWFRDNMGSSSPPTFWTICGQSGGTGADDAYRDTVRGAELAAFVDGSPNFVGANLLEQAYSDSTHPSTDAQRLAIARRFFLATKGFLAGTTATRGPRVAMVTRNGSNITITFDQSLGNTDGAALTAAAFAYTDNGTPISVSTATKTSDLVVRLVLASTPTGTGLCSFGKADSAAGATVPMSANRTLPDASSIQTPAEPFYDQSVSVSAGHFTNNFAGAVR
jgi:hypothetical protein